LEVEAQLEAKGVSLTVDEDARSWLGVRGYDPKMGARPMARVIQEHIKRPLAEELLFGKLADGGSVRGTRDKSGDSLALHCKPAREPELITQQ
ncbi:MAG: ATP-dependent Clp protease ATP-binding subunit ClpA, partial [Steroidobacteraceae bacterium]